MASSFKSPILQAIDQNGNPVPGAKLFAFASGTTTPVVIYSNQSLTTPLPNPLIANARGYFASAGGIVQNIWWDGLPLRLRLTDVDENVIWEIDDYSAASGADPAANINVTGIWAGANAKSLAALKARSVAGLTGGEAIMLIDGGRSGAFVWRAGNQSANVTVASRDAIWVVPDSLASDGSQGAWERVWSAEVNLKWWGAPGTNNAVSGPADTDAITNCFAFALEQPSHPGIVIPPGDYTTRKPINLRHPNAPASTSRRNLTVRGFGSSIVDGGTVIHYLPQNPTTDEEEGQGLLQIWSAFQMVFQGICFRVRVNGVKSILFMGAAPSPEFSGNNRLFIDCGFLPGGQTPTTIADVIMTNGKSTRLDNCVFNSVSERNVLVGDDSANWPGTLQAGIFVNATLQNCFFLSAVDIRHADATRIVSCTFGDGPNARIYSSGDQKMGATTIESCFFALEARTGFAAITQGHGVTGASTNNPGGLVVRNCGFRDYQTGVEITAGHARLEGNQYILRTVEISRSISSITPGNPTVVTTSAAHDLNNHDRVTISGVTGSTPLEGLVNAPQRVMRLSATTFSLVGVDTTGETYTSGGTVLRDKEIGVRIRGDAAITSITPGAVTRVVLATPHFRVNNDDVLITDVTGSGGLPAAINDKRHVVRVVNATTLDLINLDTTGQTYTSGGRIRGAQNVSIDNSEDFTVAFGRNNIGVQDERVEYGDSIIARGVVGSNTDIPATGSNQIVLTVPCIRKLRGGKYFVRFAACVRGSSDSAGAVRAFVRLDGVDTPAITSRVENSGDLTLTWSGTIKIPATTSTNPPNATLRVAQLAGSIPLSIRGGATAAQTFLEIEEL
jgi:hypothetical protein